MRESLNKPSLEDRCHIGDAEHALRFLRCRATKTKQDVERRPHALVVRGA